VYADTDVVIPARVQRDVPVRMVVSKPSYVIGDTIVESKRLKPGLYVGRTLVSCADECQKTVCLLNVSEVEQFVCAETCLGAISEVKVLSDEAGSETREGTSDDNEAVSDLVAKLPEELTAQQREAGASLLRRFGDIMSCNEYDIGCTPLVEHRIDTGGHRPIRQPLRRQSLAHQEIIDKQVEEMRRHGIIEPASSPWASNVVLVCKRDGSLRFCVDNRAVNNVHNLGSAIWV